MTDPDTTPPTAETDAALVAGFQELVKYLPQFEPEGFDFGEAPGLSSEGHIQMFAYAYTQTVEGFISTAYDHGVVQLDFHWSDWMQTPEAQGLRDDPKRMAEATLEQLSHLLTTVIRQDRYADGALMAAYRSGLLTAILRRASVLVTGVDGSEDQREDAGQLGLF